MGWDQGPPTWSEMERVLSGRARGHGRPGEAFGPGDNSGDGNDSPAWSRKRGKYQPDPVARIASSVPYAELHAHSAYSFLDGASMPEEMVTEAQRLDLRALSITDHDGFYGLVRFAEAAREFGMPTVFGSELSLEPDVARTGHNDPPGEHLLVLARDSEGYRRLSRTIAAAHMVAGEKGLLRYNRDALPAAAGGHWLILSGCRKGAVRRALDRGGASAAEAALGDLVQRFGRDDVAV
ncbi:PHP domain-containing protein, partial [Gordonia sp. NPDC003585]|uniref:PHP domain-containing protein n=1 Tax=Gordonia sp. NPDC003585 TaxID=3154275 RepID=UPI0033BDA0A4